jgi:peptidoglycan/xylan/chitin deacetylase (PgdA/CDA1 family)
MRKPKKQSKLKRSPFQLTATLVALCIFAFPVYSTGKWLYDATTGADPRKVHGLAAFHTRHADETNKPTKPFEQPILTITFDDGWESVYSNALPTMQEYGILSTQYILPGEFKNSAYLSKAQVQSMQKAGHQISSHTVSHKDLTKISGEQLAFEIAASKEMLEKDFGPIKDFASPLGAQNDESTAVVKKYYRSQRNTKGDPKVVGPEDVNTRENFNQYDIIAYTVRLTTTPSDITNLIEYAKANNAWLVLTYHQVDNSKATYSVTPKQFKEHMRLIWNQDIRTQTMGQVLDAIEKGKRVQQ